ncbi:hypothetical protein [Pseudomonas sp. PDM31]|uniref:hypothetical protein n=1 Tax=Pseudomonas sp. PDM31 TaxID=2854778 RepID=UPI001C46D7BF|nr:hypothetical protein [Pseudomonas sp. PDM31]MBV7477189.1 hypothetical protein [Pseudomonas sp. PDM31]
MTDEEAGLAFDAAVTAHREMFGFCDGPPYGVPLCYWVEALQEAVATGKPASHSRFWPTGPNDLA